VQALPRNYPNVNLVNLSSRTYGGWAKREGNKEPWSYETGFAVKWLTEEQINGAAELNCDPGKGAVKAPWLSWGLVGRGHNAAEGGLPFRGGGLSRG
jgi:hypothetical protein